MRGPAGHPFFMSQDVALQAGFGRVLHQTGGGAAAAAYEGNTLGVGFSGSGFLIMYFVGVTAVLKNLGIINSNTRLAGSSGGSIAGAVGCTDVSNDLFVGTAKALATSCSVPAVGRDCKRTLDVVARAGLSSILPSDAHSTCSGRLFVSVTDANANPAPDVERKISSFSSRTVLIQALLASSYIPGFSGRSAVTVPTGLGTGAAYDGVCSNPLPVPPGVDYAITVSALAGPTPPTFPSLVASANANPALFDVVGVMYRPLNPVLSPQPSRVDIYPGLSGPLRVSNDAWNSYTLKAPDSGMLQTMYDQGRKDAAAYVSANIPSKAAQVNRALQATTKDVNSVPIPSAFEAAVNSAQTVASNGVLGTLANAASNGVTTVGNTVGK